MNRKSFIIHKDSLSVLDDLSDEEAGKLFKAIANYQLGIDDKLDSLTKIAFNPFKAQFVRDEEKYQRICERNANNGSNGGRPPKPKESEETQNNPMGFYETQNNPTEPKKADSDSNSNSKNDSESKSDSKKVFNFKKSFLDLGVDEQYLTDWLIVRKRKGGANTKTSFEGFIKAVEKSTLTINEAVKLCAEKSWVGFDVDWIKPKPQQNNQPQQQPFDPTKKMSIFEIEKRLKDQILNNHE